MSKEKEIWSDIARHEGSYQISSFGRVKSLKRHKLGKRNKKGEHGLILVPERILKPGCDKDGYLRVVLQLDGNKKEMRIHRIVANAFIPNPLNHPVVHHKDECVTNNHIDNLEWVTCRQNLYASNVFGKLAKIHGKPLVLKDSSGKVLASFASCSQASRITGIDPRNISAVVNGRRNHTRGLIFERAEQI